MRTLKKCKHRKSENAERVGTMSKSKSLTFVHTAPGNVTTFDKLVKEIDPTVPVKHVLDESLLRDARAFGITTELAERIHSTLVDAMDSQTALIVCTCSTIGGVAEETILPNGQRVMRVDRAMAEKAVSYGDRIVVAAALESTLAPTSDLIRAVAAEQGREVDICPLLCVRAWERFEADDQAGYWAEIAAALHQALAEGGKYAGDVIVLAQASMAGAAALCEDIAIPILSSPRLGLEAALAAYRAAS
jgi:hypothetical protein